MYNTYFSKKGIHITKEINDDHVSADYIIDVGNCCLWLIRL